MTIAPRGCAVGTAICLVGFYGCAVPHATTAQAVALSALLLVSLRFVDLLYGYAAGFR